MVTDEAGEVPASGVLILIGRLEQIGEVYGSGL